MTGRPPLAPGEHGVITSRQIAQGKHEARVLVRNHDGTRRDLRSTGSTKGAAIRKLERKLDQRSRTSSTEGITSGMTVAEVCDYFLAHRLKQATTRTGAVGRGSRRGLLPQTVASYAAPVESLIKPLLGELRVQEVTVGRLDAVILDLDHAGVSTALMRSVLSQAFGMAVRHQAIPTYPMKSLEPRARREREVDALTVVQVQGLRNAVDPATRRHAGRRGPNRDLGDLVDLALGTGARIGEILALQWRHLDLHPHDDTAPTVLINGTLIEPRTGYVPDLHRQEFTKSRHNRQLTLPAHVATLLAERAEHTPHTRPEDPVFACRTGTWLWPNNIRTRLRAALADTGYEGTTPHTLRRTVGTLIANERGLEAAGYQLGHTQPGITAKYYVAPRLLMPDHTDLLDTFFALAGQPQPGESGDKGCKYVDGEGPRLRKSSR